MTAPPGAALVAGARWNHVSEKAGAVSHAMTQEVVKQARDTMGVLGLDLSANKLSRLIREYLTTATTTQTFGEWVIAYADPTGETAARNVDRGRGW